jgi:hypothetical protein
MAVASSHYRFAKLLLLGCLVTWLLCGLVINVAWLLGRLAAWLFAWLFGCLLGCLVAWLLFVLLGLATMETTPHARDNARPHQNFLGKYSS